jgi:hypothetical protein
VFAGTVFGESAGGLKAFWETAAWSKLFQRMVLDEMGGAEPAPTKPRKKGK